ncbi:hypothetical protein DY000_02015986 [Brassica cretica]|uniref:Uncharacterized protein n=1 Tax=Brassica cretica TaxID=69181 RepID=A0ABQ7D1G3_BRACR|nr:hypothetical protein DY000_02015986 [Brassica cretica]
MSGLEYRSMSDGRCRSMEDECLWLTVVSEYRSTGLVPGSTVVERNRATNRCYCRSMRSALLCGLNAPNMQDLSSTLINKPIGSRFLVARKRSGASPPRLPAANQEPALSTHHQATWACPDQLAIRRPGPVPSNSPLGDLGRSRPTFPHATWAGPVQLAIRRPGPSPSNLPSGDLGWSRPNCHQATWAGPIQLAIR